MVKIYVDMDNVLTDFSQAVQNLGPEAAQGLVKESSPEQKELMYRVIERMGPTFWSSMEWLEEGRKLWNYIKSYNPVILSSPGQYPGRFMDNAKMGKQVWLTDNLPGVTYILTPDKYQYAERNAILIDDMKENCDSWAQSDGIPILFDGSADNALTLLNNILNDKLISAAVKNALSLSRM